MFTITFLERTVAFMHVLMTAAMVMMRLVDHFVLFWFWIEIYMTILILSNLSRFSIRLIIFCKWKTSDGRQARYCKDQTFCLAVPSPWLWFMIKHTRWGKFCDLLSGNLTSWWSDRWTYCSSSFIGMNPCFRNLHHYSVLIPLKIWCIV